MKGKSNPNIKILHIQRLDEPNIPLLNLGKFSTTSTKTLKLKLTTFEGVGLHDG